MVFLWATHSHTSLTRAWTFTASLWTGCPVTEDTIYPNYCVCNLIMVSDLNNKTTIGQWFYMEYLLCVMQLPGTHLLVLSFNISKNSVRNVYLRHHKWLIFDEKRSRHSFSTVSPSTAWCRMQTWLQHRTLEIIAIFDQQCFQVYASLTHGTTESAWCGRWESFLEEMDDSLLRLISQNSKYLLLKYE